MQLHGGSPFPPDDDDGARGGASAAAARWLAVASAALVAMIAVSRLLTCACPHSTDLASAADVALRDA